MVFNWQRIFAVAVVLSLGSSAVGALNTQHIDANSSGSGVTVDGTIGANEYGPGNSYVYTGGGTGFGGTLGGAGAALYFESDVTNLYVGFQPGNNFNDNVVIHMDTKSGGFTDAQMNDTADPGRNLLTNLTRDVDDTFPTDVLPDYGLVIGQFGMVLFELNAGNTPGHLTFKQFDGTFTGNNPALAREIAIPLATLGNPNAVNFFASYGSDSNFMSNESIPGEGFNAGANPGFGSSAVAHDNYDQFVMVVVPEPGAFLLCGAVAVLAASVAAKKRMNSLRLRTEITDRSE